MNIKNATVVGLLSIAVFWHIAYAAAPADQARLISDMADRICVQAATGGTSRSANLQASVGAELSNLLRRLVNAKADVRAEAQGEIHSGVLPGQVLTAAEQANNCKLKVLQILTPALLGRKTNGGNVQTTYGPNSPIFGNVSGGTITIGK
ncbi:hypothetical protein [Burkholderia sp. WP9]|uniref:hypothetical protein n=1 Tax=Burkholderia sp. WP9 TaxID=1500263 RepID=UPI00115FBDA1|nr:hypothetical protein [Burkholderia sp. WP9]